MKKQWMWEVLVVSLMLAWGYTAIQLGIARMEVRKLNGEIRGVK